ncbi:MAG: PQQ-binding-like beta-propeller repeat protein [Bacteroidia bacterium]|nr:PQQ-binding-like beta-propeller repeat protein [Bacteroidia bacterium]
MVRLKYESPPKSSNAENPLCPNPKGRLIFSDFPLGIKGKKSLKSLNTTFRRGLKYITLIIFFLTRTTPFFSQTSTNWPIYRGDNSLTGNTQCKIPEGMKILWSYKTGGEIKSSPVISDNTIFIGSTDGNLYALNKNGSLKWKFNTKVAIEAPPVYINQLVIVGNLEGTVYAVNAATGKQAWTYKTDGQVSGSVNWIDINEKIQILIPSYDYAIHCVNLTDGKLVWKCETNNYLNGAPTTDNKNIIIGGCDAKVHIINAKTGKEIGGVDAGTYIAVSSALSGNYAYMGDYDGNFLCVDIINKKIVWKKETSQNAPFLSSPAVTKDKVIAGSHDKKVYCFDKKNGKVLWTFQTLGKIESSPVISNDRVLICSKDGWIRILSLTNGKEIQKYELGVAITCTPAVIDNLIVVGAADGKVYALGKK